MSKLRVLRRALPVAASLVALPAVPAAASSVAVEGTEIVYRGDAASDRVFVRGPVESPRSPVTYAVQDTDRFVEAGAGCEATGGREVLCSLPGDAQATLIRVDLAGATDLLDADEGSITPLRVDGGEGADQFSGGGGADRLDGGPGDDFLSGDETTFGSSLGENVRKAPDVLLGGEGNDTVSYGSHRSSGVSVSLDDRADDGQAGEGDDVRSDVENVVGDFAAANVLSGSEAANRFIGGDLVDSLSGGGGDDQLDARGGDDRLDGGAGFDLLQAGAGADVLAARDGFSDRLDCGTGADSATVDAFDMLSTGEETCESVDRPPAPAPPPAPPPPAQPVRSPFAVGVAARSLRPTRTGRVRVTLTCSAAATAGCNGTLRLASTRTVRVDGRSRILSLGSRSFSIAPGRSERVTFVLSRVNRAALRRLKRISLRLTAKERAAAPRTYAKTLTLRR